MAKKAKSKNKRVSRWIGICVLLILVLMVSLVIYWVSKNTAFLSGKIKPADLSSNNLNSSDSPFNLISQKILYFLKSTCTLVNNMLSSK